MSKYITQPKLTEIVEKNFPGGKPQLHRHHLLEDTVHEYVATIKKDLGKSAEKMRENADISRMVYSLKHKSQPNLSLEVSRNKKNYSLAVYSHPYRPEDKEFSITGISI